MINFSILETDSIVLCPTNIKTNLIKLKNTTFPLKNIKFIDKQSFIKKLFFSYDLNTVAYLSSKYHYNLDLIYEILDNMWNICRYNEKLNHLNEIYLELKENKLVEEDLLFKESIKNKKVYIYQYSNRDLEIFNICKMFNIDYSFIEPTNQNDYKSNVYFFNTIEEEVIYVINKICQLINNNVDLNHIYLFNLPLEYQQIIRKYLKLYQIPFEDNEKLSLYDSLIFKKFLSYANSITLDESYKKIVEETKNDSLDVLSNILNLVIKLRDLSCDNNFKKELLIYLSKHQTLNNIKYDKSLKICNELSLITDEDYVFMLGFSQGSYPFIYNDTDFFSDYEKEVMIKNTSTILNDIKKEQLITFIKNTKNLHISYKKQVGKNIYYPSLLIEYLNMNIIQNNETNKRYSKNQAMIEVAKYYDLEKMFGIRHKYMYTFQKDDLSYGTYDHQYNGQFKKDASYETYSYTKISEYNNCPFKYYLKRILKIDPFEESFSINLGILCHKILDDSEKNEIDLNDYNQEIQEHFKTAKEQFFIKLLLPQIINVINKNKDFLKISFFNKVSTEDEIKLKIDDSNDLVGKVDKILFDESGQNLIVIDYKTSNFSFEKEKVKYGIDLQLPVYSLLLKEKFPTYTNVGIYIQNICAKEEDEENKNYLLNGLTLNDLDKISRLDPEVGTLFEDDGKYIPKSRFIKGVSITKNKSLGSSKYLITKEDLEQLTKEALEQIKITIEKIKCGKFEISPLKFSNSQHSSCVYCNFKDICFKKNQDIRLIEINKNDTESDGE